MIDECSLDDQGQHTHVTVLGDGSAILFRTRVTSFSTGMSVHEPQRRYVLKPPEYFEQCIGSDDLALVRQCLFDWYEPDQCIPEVCCPAQKDTDLPLCEFAR